MTGGHCPLLGLGVRMHGGVWAGIAGVPLAVGWVNAWLIPGILALLLIAAIWVGVRWNASEHLDALRRVPLFQHLSPGQLRGLANRVRRVEFAPRAAITEESQRGGGLYLVEEGTATVTVGGHEKATLEPGAYFGEIALIDGGPRSATVTAVSKVSVLELPSSAFLALLDRDASVGGVVEAELRRRLRNEGSTPSEGSSDTASLADLCRLLRAAQGTDWGQAALPRRWWRVRGGRP